MVWWQFEEQLSGCLAAANSPLFANTPSLQSFGLQIESFLLLVTAPAKLAKAAAAARSVSGVINKANVIVNLSAPRTLTHSHIHTAAHSQPSMLTLIYCADHNWMTFGGVAVLVLLLVVVVCVLSMTMLVCMGSVDALPLMAVTASQFAAARGRTQQF